MASGRRYAPVEGWSIVASSRAAFIANILLYMPLGFCAVLAVRRGSGTARRVALITLAGALLSITMEVTQYFDGSSH